MTPQEANPAGHHAQPPTMAPGADDRRRSYGRRVGDRFPVHSPNRAVELAKGITAMAGAAFAVAVLLMVAVWLCRSLFES
ncbi:MAG: hypothetical protein QOE54_2054 [Streptosporangiaceae bacterium]|jgi:hypothetical protein|nr:hypothetical protein [Streptosporangiaceae bacterium]MDX6429688.1 hypothetical protein [Streptosporangiaceae bacterium]